MRRAALKIGGRHETSSAEPVSRAREPPRRTLRGHARPARFAARRRRPSTAPAPAGQPPGGSARSEGAVRGRKRGGDRRRSLRVRSSRWRRRAVRPAPPPSRRRRASPPGSREDRQVVGAAAPLEVGLAAQRAQARTGGVDQRPGRRTRAKGKASREIDLDHRHAPGRRSASSVSRSSRRRRGRRSAATIEPSAARLRRRSAASCRPAPRRRRAAGVPTAGGGELADELRRFVLHDEQARAPPPLRRSGSPVTNASPCDAHVGRARSTTPSALESRPHERRAIASAGSTRSVSAAGSLLNAVHRSCSLEAEAIEPARRPATRGCELRDREARRADRRRALRPPGTQRHVRDAPGGAARRSTKPAADPCPSRAGQLHGVVDDGAWGVRSRCRS